jgi:hypothetical protein
MSRCLSLAIAAAVLAFGFNLAAAQSPTSQNKACHMEQQCHWENFKKICTWVKICR